MNSKDFAEIVLPTNLTVPDIKSITLEVYSIFIELNKNKSRTAPQTDFQLYGDKYYTDTFLKVQEVIEGDVDLPMDVRIEITDDFTKILIFLKAVKDLNKEIYLKYKKDIIFEFIFILGSNIERLHLNVGLIS